MPAIASALTRPAVHRRFAAAVFVLAGAAHFLWPAFYREQVPAAAGDAAFWVAFTGVAEIAGGLGLLVPRLRRVAAAGLVLMLAGFLWVHVGHLIDPPTFRGRTLPRGVLIARVPFQLVLIAWVVFCGRTAAGERGRE